ncbi:hypothetical protein HY990_00470 [Candidatus Micrarchaeota archaeon]|nr:hypothetical protein [Candidatus Micrarchaeota archaeon]
MTKNLIALGFVFFLLLIIFGCTENSSKDETGLVGSWRIYPATTNYKGEVDYSKLSSRKLEIKEDGNWQFGSSSGSWKIETISSQDWERWETEPYEPTKRLVLNGWDGKTVDGPIEGEEGRPDFIWLIYEVKDSQGQERQLQLKFGH